MAHDNGLSSKGFGGLSRLFLQYIEDNNVIPEGKETAFKDAVNQLYKNDAFRKLVNSKQSGNVEYDQAVQMVDKHMNGNKNVNEFDARIGNMPLAVNDGEMYPSLRSVD